MTQDVGMSEQGRVSVKIRGVECVPLHVPFKVPFQISVGAARPVVEVLVVKIHTDQGVVGVGETQAWRRHGSDETLARQVETIETHFVPRLVGRSPLEVDALMSDLDASRGGSLYSQAAVGDGLYDLAGKLRDVPVYELLGGRARDRVRVAAVLSMKGSVDSLLDSAAEFFEAGFRHFILKIGIDPAVDVRNAEALRAKYSRDTCEIRVDANAALAYEDALDLLTRLEPLGLESAEQPLALEDLDGMAALSRVVRIPLMADECVSTEASLARVIRKRAAAAAQTKTAKNGGIHHIRRLWQMLAEARMGINPGNHPATTIATASVAHMCAAWPDPLMAGTFAVGVSGALVEDVVETPIRPVNGEILTPSGPGLGVNLDEEALRRFRVDL